MSSVPMHLGCSSYLANQLKNVTPIHNGHVNTAAKTVVTPL